MQAVRKLPMLLKVVLLKTVKMQSMVANYMTCWVMVHLLEEMEYDCNIGGTGETNINDAIGRSIKKQVSILQ
jgi:hypothetical protein